MMSEFSDDEDVVVMEGKSDGPRGACGAVHSKENVGTIACYQGKARGNESKSPIATPTKKLEQSLLSNFFGFGRSNEPVARDCGSGGVGGGGKRKITPNPSPEQKKRKSEDRKKKSGGKPEHTNNSRGISTILNFFHVRLGSGSEKSSSTDQGYDAQEVEVIETKTQSKKDNDSCELKADSGRYNNRRSSKFKSKVSEESSKLEEEVEAAKEDADGAKQTKALQFSSVSSSEEAPATGVTCDDNGLENETGRIDDKKTEVENVTTSIDVDCELSISDDDDNSSQGSSRSPSPSVPEGEYEVEEIWDYKKPAKSCGLYYVKWKGYSEDENTWEPIENLEHCDFLLNAFYNMRKEEIQKGDGYVTENGTRRKLHMPPDPRPFVRKIRAFLESQPSVSEDEINWALAMIQSAKNFLWSIQKTEKFMFESYEGKLKESQMVELRQQLVYRDIEDRHKDQLKKLKNWQKQLNSVTKGRPTIEVENEVDLSLPPPDFEYINDYVATDGIIIPDDPPFGCVCNGICGKDTCCPVIHGTKFAYRSNKKIFATYDSYMIYECNKKCTCGPECPNRVVQDGVNPLKRHKLCIFRTKHCGWGVKTLRPIKKGTFVCMYVGEILTTTEAERRGEKYDEEGTTYLFDLDFNSTDNPYTVDARYKGNVSHFINHSCDPNLAVYGVWVDCLDVNLPKLALFAEKDIAVNEELYFDYKSGNKANETNDGIRRENGPLIKRLPCMCLSENCRKVLFT